MNRILKLLLSMEVMIVLTIIFAVSSAVATFIENDFGTETAWAVVYSAKWFELVQILLAINLFGNLFRYKIFSKNKIPVALFHVGFLVILLGAGITRYVGFEGIMHIREGNSQNLILSSEPYIQANAEKDGKIYSVMKPKLISKISSNDFKMILDISGEEAVITYKKFVPNATTKIVDDPSGIPMISMMATVKGKAADITLKDGEVFDAGDVLFTLNKTSPQTNKPIVEFFTKENKFYFKSTSKTAWFKMRDNTKGNFEANTEYEFKPSMLYTVNALNFAPKEMHIKGKKAIVAGEPSNGAGGTYSALITNISYKGENKEVVLYGKGRGAKGLVTTEQIAGTNFQFEWGSKVVELPFSIKLTDFQLERYPGSQSPSSYASEVVVIDEPNGVNMPFKIFMNHILDYQSYRFFQSSYDMDEKGTILSVNNDPGKWPTYIGYTLLSIGFFLNILNPKSRFRKLAKAIQKDTIQKGAASIIAALSLLLLNTPLEANESQDILQIVKSYDKDHADKFGTILIQSLDGRIKPIDTLANDILNKVSRKINFIGLNANQIVLGMMATPKEWQRIKMIKVFHPELKKMFGLGKKDKYAAFNDFFDYSQQNPYKLAQYAEIANHKKPAERNQFDKDVLKVDERINVSYMTYTGDLLKMFPKKGDPSNTWYSPKDAISSFSAEESEKIRGILTKYFDGIAEGRAAGKWENANNAINNIKAYQNEIASAIVPNEQHINGEILFNNLRIFQKLIPVYLLAGLFLLFAIFTKMVKTRLNLSLFTKIIFSINILAFIVHTFGLGLRWYISGHAPWSDSYESMLFIAWSIIFAGIIFSKHSTIALALTSILAGVTLFVAHLSWIDPQITNLVPVLKSYWLQIHVSVITSSYGFLGLSSLLGFFTLFLFILRRKGHPELDRSIRESSRINEMSMILGISLLTVGNFLGGVWANESWGRYWGWDPKETWAWISILVYVIVLHLRFIPKLNNYYTLAVTSTIAYASIIMTYFGVNFYLSGMHSYAAGDPVPVPTFVYYAMVIVFAIILLAYPKRHLKKS